MLSYALPFELEYLIVGNMLLLYIHNIYLYIIILHIFQYKGQTK